MGKTQTAIEYTFSREANFDAIYWHYADDKTVLAQSMANIGRELGREEASEGAQNLPVSCAKVQEWLKKPVKSLKSGPGGENKAN
jgi:hypothetical protein